ncbi:type I-F CRISPR-associated endoribonuclease Cas6/Csy4 [Yersinia sp. 2553 StPb PI]
MLFLRLKSQFSTLHFLLFIEQGELQKILITGRFSVYGCSIIATILYF